VRRVLPLREPSCLWRHQVPLRVVELTGKPGDVILMHGDSFHAVAPNRLTEPRMMLTGMAGSDRSQQ
jgi:hypothetical protein